MKKLLFLLLLTTITVCSFSQPVNNAVPAVKADYLQKSNHQKTAAWIMLGGGTSLFVVGGLVGAHGFFDLFTLQPDNANAKIELAGILALTGTAALLGSIPLFIASSKNKKKAATLSFKNEPVLQIHKSSFVYRCIPSLALKFDL